MNKVSVIILNWNRKNDVAETIKKLHKQTVKPFEIILVDNASTDGSVKLINKKFPHVRTVSLDKNIALAGFNYGMEKAGGDLFLLLASDAMPRRDLVAKHIEKFKKNLKLGVSCPVTYEYKSKKYLAPNRSILGDNKTGYTVTYFDGNGVCIKKSVFKKTKGYSPDYFICLEELEWAVRILSAGFEIKAFTDVVNYNTKSLLGSQRKNYGYYYARNWIWFYIKYLPFAEIPKFLRLHIRSFFTKTDKIKGSMNKMDIIRGVFAGFVLSSKFLSNRKVLSKKIIERVRLDLFPNGKHLYVRS